MTFPFPIVPPAAAASHRYWRILCTSGAQRQIAEIQLKESAGGSDAIPTMTAATTSGVTMSGDSVFSGQEAWHAGKDDGDTLFFGSNGSAGSCWIKVDFGAGNTKNIVQWTVQAHSPATNAPADMKLQWSDDDSAWTDVSTQTGLSWSALEVKTFSVP